MQYYGITMTTFPPPQQMKSVLKQEASLFPPFLDRKKWKTDCFERQPVKVQNKSFSRHLPVQKTARHSWDGSHGVVHMGAADYITPQQLFKSFQTFSSIRMLRWIFGQQVSPPTHPFSQCHNISTKKLWLVLSYNCIRWLLWVRARVDVAADSILSHGSELMFMLLLVPGIK